MKNLIGKMKKEYFEIVTWPEIQNYMECDGFNLNCSLANSEFDVERYGSSAYYVNSKWKQEQDKILYNELI